MKRDRSCPSMKPSWTRGFTRSLRCMMWPLLALSHHFWPLAFFYRRRRTALRTTETPRPSSRWPSELTSACSASWTTWTRMVLFHPWMSCRPPRTPLTWGCPTCTQPPRKSLREEGNTQNLNGICWLFTWGWDISCITFSRSQAGACGATPRDQRGEEEDPQEPERVRRPVL